ncbi:MAG: hypothetical protein AAFX50_09695 [Acidobacteriota bacterium]
MKTKLSAPSSFAASALLLALFAPPCHAQKAWTLGFPVELSLLDFQTAEAEAVAPVELADVFAMARGVDGDFWIIARETFVPSVVSLHRLDSKRFTLETIGPLNLQNFVRIQGMTVLPSGRILMSAGGGTQTAPGVYDIDPGTGQSTLIGNTQGTIAALANLGGQVFGLYRQGLDYQLAEVDPSTAHVTLLFSLPGQAIAGQPSMASAADGRLYVVSQSVPPVDPGLYVDTTAVIDPVSGETQLLAEFTRLEPVAYIGLALTDGPSVVDVPGPGAVGQLVLWTLLLAAGLAFIRFRL